MNTDKHLVKIMLGLVLVFVGLFVMMQFPTNVEGDTIVVANDGNGDYEDIQGAIDAAMEGDSIRVWEGIYNENIVVNKTVSLVGNESEVITINAGGNGSAVRITADWVGMSGFSVTGSQRYYSGIWVESDYNLIFDNNCSSNWYGIYLNSSSNSTIANNTCSANDYYGILLERSNDCTITNNTCSENTFSGILLKDSSYCTIENNTCSANQASIYDDIGIILERSNDCTITNNTCSNNDKGISLSGSTHCTIENNTCSENNEHGIDIWHSNNSTITKNTCSSNDYYGILLSSSNDCTIENNTISENRIGIKLKSSSQSDRIHHNNIFNNTVYGIEASDNIDPIKASYNWWGDASGPYHPSENTDGKRDAVTDNVIFSPWLDENGEFRNLEDDEADNGGGFLPGFSVMTVIGAIGSILILSRKRNHL